MLQWGHAFVSVETAGGIAKQGGEGVASMGPRFCKRGNRWWLPLPCATPRQLQWGHAFVSVETAFVFGKAQQPFQLQWGHAFVSVETWYGGVKFAWANELQWGHAFVSVETRRERLSLAGACIASMGPRFCKRGNSISHRGASIPPFLAPAARSDATSAYFGRLGRDFAGHFPARRASSPL